MADFGSLISLCDRRSTSLFMYLSFHPINSYLLSVPKVHTKGSLEHASVSLLQTDLAKLFDFVEIS